jgi:hypothetical protein
VLPRELAHNGQSLAIFTERPPQAFFNAALLHPIKHPDEMALFHHQTLHHLRPILPAIKAPKHNAPKHHHHLFKNAMIHIHKSCVNNVVFQTQRPGGDGATAKRTASRAGKKDRPEIAAKREGDRP